MHVPPWLSAEPRAEDTEDRYAEVVEAPWAGRLPEPGPREPSYSDTPTESVADDDFDDLVEDAGFDDEPEDESEDHGEEYDCAV